MKYSPLPFFSFFILITVPFFAQTELDSHAQAAVYGKDYVPVPENQAVLTPSLLDGIWQGRDRYVFFIAPPEEPALAAEIDRTQSEVIVDPINTSMQVMKKTAAVQPSDLTAPQSLSHMQTMQHVSAVRLRGKRPNILKLYMNLFRSVHLAMMLPVTVFPKTAEPGNLLYTMEQRIGT